MSSSEEVAYPILRKHDVEYVLVIFGGLIGYSGDDINKFLWMVRIAQGVWPDEIQEPNYFTPAGEYKVDAQASPAMKNSLMYKMSYYRYGTQPSRPLFASDVIRTIYLGSTSFSGVTLPSIESVTNNYPPPVQHWTTSRRRSRRRTGSSGSIRSRRRTLWDGTLKALTRSRRERRGRGPSPPSSENLSLRARKLDIRDVVFFFPTPIFTHFASMDIGVLSHSILVKKGDTFRKQDTYRRFVSFLIADGQVLVLGDWFSIIHVVGETLDLSPDIPYSVQADRETERWVGSRREVLVNKVDALPRIA